MNKWVNPSSRMKTEDKVPPLNSTNCIPAPSFDIIKKQVRKKRLSEKSKEQRIADKSISLAERVGYETTNKTNEQRNLSLPRCATTERGTTKT